MATTTIELDQKDIAQAVREYILRQYGSEAGDVSFDASANADMMDRPTGGHTISARATLKKKKPDFSGKD